MNKLVVTLVENPISSPDLVVFVSQVFLFVAALFLSGK